MLRKCCNAGAGRYPQACLDPSSTGNRLHSHPRAPCSLQQLGPALHSPECAKVTGSANDSSHPSPGWEQRGAAPSLLSISSASESRDRRRRLSRERKDKQESGWVQKRGGAGEE